MPGKLTAARPIKRQVGQKEKNAKKSHGRETGPLGQRKRERIPSQSRCSFPVCPEREKPILEMARLCAISFFYRGW